jgi:outer membrane protein assembly factor BamD
VGCRLLEVIYVVLSKTGRRAVIALILIAAVAASGCSLFKKKAPTVAFQERPVELLYSVGAHNLDQHQWKEAINYFHEVERQHPYSEWARRSMLMTAYAHYEMNDYASAIQDANQFIALYPGNTATPYAFYIRAVCYFEQIVDVGRDQSATGQAQIALNEILRRYPQSPYALDAKLKYELTRDQLAGKEMTIGRFYLRNGNPVAAVGRFQNVVNNFQTTTHAPEALYRLVEADLTMGMLEEAKRNAAVLGFNYPGDYWYGQAYKLMTSKGMRPSLTPGVTSLPRLPFTKKAVSPDIAPPPVEELAAQEAAGPTATVADNNMTAPDVLTGKPAPGAKTKAPPKPKQHGFVHGVLGL